MQLRPPLRSQNGYGRICYKQLNNTAKVKSAGEAPDDIPGACVPANPTVSKQRHLIAYQVPVAAEASALKK